MRFYRVISALLALLLISTAMLTAVSAAGVPGAVDSQRLEQKMAKATLGTAKGTLGYRIYRSKTYNPSVDNKPATLIIYLHDEAGKGDDNTAQLKEKSLLNQLVSDEADSAYSKYQYIVAAPQCPAGKSFSDPDMIELIEELRQELMATEIIAKSCMLMGVGTGADGAFEYAYNYVGSVARVLSVGGTPDKVKLLGAVSTGVTLMAFSENGNTAFDDFLRYANSMNEADYITHIKAGDNTDQCLEAALNYDEPSVTDWLVKDSYESRYFKVSVRCTEGGGKISASPENVKYGGNSSVVLVVEKGYAITGLTVDGEKKEISLLEQSSSNKNQYTYSFMGVIEDHSLLVELSSVGGVGDEADFIASLILWLSVISGVLVVAAAAVAVSSMLANRKKA